MTGRIEPGCLARVVRRKHLVKPIFQGLEDLVVVVGNRRPDLAEVAYCSACLRSDRYWGVEWSSARGAACECSLQRIDDGGLDDADTNDRPKPVTEETDGQS